MVKMHTSFARNTELKNWLFLVVVGVVLVLVASCDKEDAGPAYTQADRDRCAHIDRDAELGEYLYGICLSGAWPTELPPATQQGLSTFGCWINDTLAFVARDPEELPSTTARANSQDPGVFTLIAYYDTWNEIDPRRIDLGLRLENGVIYSSVSSVSFRSMIGYSREYVIDSIASSIAYTIDEDRRIAHGSFNLLAVNPRDSTDIIHLSDGRFDVGYSKFY